jgi:hypothetical protein
MQKRRLKVVKNSSISRTKFNKNRSFLIEKYAKKKIKGCQK